MLIPSFIYSTDEGMVVGSGSSKANRTDEDFALLKLLQEDRQSVNNNHESDQDNLAGTKCLVDNQMG